MRILIRPAIVLALLGLSHVAFAQGRNQLAPGPAMARIMPELPPIAAGIAWPRLDPGAVICRTQDDLRRWGEAQSARASGTPFSGPAPSCRAIARATPIDVIARPMPSATEVRLKTQGAEVAWTDTWLPERAPR